MFQTKFAAVRIPRDCALSNRCFWIIDWLILNFTWNLINQDNDKNRNSNRNFFILIQISPEIYLLCWLHEFAIFIGQVRISPFLLVAIASHPIYVLPEKYLWCWSDEFAIHIGRVRIIPVSLGDSCYESWMNLQYALDGFALVQYFGVLFWIQHMFLNCQLITFKFQTRI